MKEAVKIVTIGGGSSYTPELMEGFIKRYEELPIREIWLVDIEDGREKVEIVGSLAQRMWDATPYDVKVHVSLDRREALKEADFVTTQFRVGLLDARIKDERIPLLHGMLGQETNGAGVPHHTGHQRNRRGYERTLSGCMADQFYESKRHDHRGSDQTIRMEKVHRALQCSHDLYDGRAKSAGNETGGTELPVCRAESFSLA